MMLIKVCRQWKLEFLDIGLPKDIDLISGLPRIYTIDKSCDFKYVYLETESNLRFNTREIVEKEHKTGNDLLDKLVQVSMKRMQGTRAKTAYRSVITHSKENNILLLSDYFEMSGAVGESYQVFAMETVKDPEHISVIINRKYQTTFGCYPEEHTSKSGMFRFIKLRDPIQVRANLMDLVVSHYDQCNHLSLDKDRIQLHIMRKYKTIELEEPLFESKTTSFLDAISICDEKIREMELNSTSCNVVEVGTKDQEIKYTRYVYYPPASIKFVRRRVSFKAPINFFRLDNSKRYIPTRTTDILRISFDEDRELRLYRESIGSPIPSLKVIDIEVADIDFASLSYINFESCFKHEVKYRSQRGDKIFLNLSVDKSKIKGELTISESKSETINSAEGKSLEEMFTDLESLDASAFGDVIIESDRLDQQEDREDDQSEEGGVNEDWLSSGVVKPQERVTVEIDTKLGILTNPSWTLKMLATECLILKLLDLGILYKQSWRKFDIFEFTDDNIIYSFDRDFKRKIDFLAHYSKSKIRQENVERIMNVKETLKRIVQNDYKINDIWLLLLNGFPTISISTTATGKLITKAQFKDIMENL